MATHPTLVLVHGAWNGSWTWSDVGVELDRHHVEWTSVELPSSTPGASAHTYLADDARAVASIANEHGGPVVLVGHSYGGAVITEAAALVEHLVGLIYVAAIVPALGASATETIREVPVRTLLDEAIGLDGEFLVLDPALAAAALYQDCEENLAHWAVEQHTPQTLASFRSPRTEPDVDVPSTYIVCTDDLAIDPAQQVHMAQRCREVVELASGHCPQLSMPHTLTDQILSLASRW